MTIKLNSCPEEPSINTANNDKVPFYKYHFRINKMHLIWNSQSARLMIVQRKHMSIQRA